MRGVVAVTDRQRGEPDGLDRRSQTALETDLDLHRARPELDVAQAVGEDRIGQQRRGGRAVADGLSGLDRRVREKARAEVLDGVLELDLLHDRHPVVADERQAVLLLDQHRPRLRTEGAPHSIGQCRRASEELGSGLVAHEQFGVGHVPSSRHAGEREQGRKSLVLAATVAARDLDRSPPPKSKGPFCSVVLADSGPTQHTRTPLLTMSRCHSPRSRQRAATG